MRSNVGMKFPKFDHENFFHPTIINIIPNEGLIDRFYRNFDDDINILLTLNDKF